MSGVAAKPAEVTLYAGCTMLASSMAKEKEEEDDSSESDTIKSGAILDCVQFLQENEFIVLRKKQIKG